MHSVALVFSVQAISPALGPRTPRVRILETLHATHDHSKRALLKLRVLARRAYPYRATQKRPIARPRLLERTSPHLTPRALRAEIREFDDELIEIPIDLAEGTNDERAHPTILLEFA